MSSTTKPKRLPRTQSLENYYRRAAGPDAPIGGVSAEPLLVVPLPVPSNLLDLAARELSGGAPLVHPQQTSDSHRSQTAYRNYATRTVKPHLARFRDILDNSESMTASKHLNRLDDCRSSAWFTVHRKTKAVRVASNRCNLRWCPMCQRTRRHIIASGVSEWLGKAKAPKFLTLTLKSSPAPLDFQLRSLYTAFRKFRRRKFPNDLIAGGFWFFQVTYNRKTYQWHPHIHCLIDSDFLPQRKLSKAWLSASHGSSVVDIRTVSDPIKSAQYVARYATSPASLLSFTPDQGLELIEALHDQRIVGAWGNARGIPLAPRKPDDADQWVRAVNFTSVMSQKAKQPIFQELYQCWRSGQPFESDVDVFGLSWAAVPELIALVPESKAEILLEFSGPISLTSMTTPGQNEPMEY